MPKLATEEEPAKKYVDLQCPCRDGGSCPSPPTSVLPSPVPTLSLHTTCSQPTTLTPLYLAVENAVRGSGDGRVTFEVEVKLIWGCATALHVQQVELLVQDGEGQYSAVLRPIGSGQGWEGVLSGDVDKVVRARVKVWGMLGIQDRHTRSNHPGLFRVLCGQGGDVQQQRIIYSLGMSGGGLEILQQGKEPEITCPSLHQASGLAPGSRVNVGCNVLHLEKEGEAGTLYLQELEGGRSLLVPCDLSSMLVAQVLSHIFLSKSISYCYHMFWEYEVEKFCRYTDTQAHSPALWQVLWSLLQVQMSLSNSLWTNTLASFIASQLPSRT